MPVTATSYQALAQQAAVTMLSGSATFRALVGASTPTQALARIVESWGGNPARVGKGKAKATDGTLFAMAPTFALVARPHLDTERVGVGVVTYRGRVPIEIVMPRVQTGESPAEAFRRAQNDADAIRAELQAQEGSAGCFATCTVMLDGPGMPDETGADGDSMLAALFIDFEG